jgi:hypothetical protein
MPQNQIHRKRVLIENPDEGPSVKDITAELPDLIKLLTRLEYNNTDTDFKQAINIVSKMEVNIRDLKRFLKSERTKATILRKEEYKARKRAKEQEEENQ